ncbi:5-formyltetrahydrofolate cyclo-ligase [Desulforamulus aeronauticus]|uniref:5-formyltetrahydrofolate cyclo-ligase n=1 Tax=Desulforamulus aeronauticus DSM 10349 TaxID=1121421 RepID=A0A1M6UET8_9FIRM|nr:5-formyltetrahydrofolate cyclo-ligase [Desulforamulus aeronauticus]SHK67724.1 5-formyltetrahydrofolate cyclo-ligase [Desulforamulus aeronauticus DSM 10349]
MQEAKQMIRQQVLAARRSLTPTEALEKSSRITQRLLELPQYGKARTILTYLDFRGEVCTGSFISQALEAGKIIAVPLVNKTEKRMTPCQLVNYPEELVPGAYGILEPAPDKIRPVPVETVDMVLVPGVVFDEQGHRLGYGGGFYDRFLPQLRPDAVIVALAYELQIWPDLISLMADHDQPVAVVITEDRIIRTNEMS